LKINYIIVNISIFNALGQKIADLISEKQREGNHQINLNAMGFISKLKFLLFNKVSLNFEMH